MRIIFLGASDFSSIVFNKLVEQYEVVAVITPPDKEIGRGKGTKPCFLKVAALEKGVKVLQYNKVSKEGIEDIKALNVDLAITAAFGQILSDEFLSIPKFGVFNVHASLLPKYRGASPIQASIINGDNKTGITIMKTVKELDAGDIISQREIEIEKEDTAGSLFDKLAVVGGELLVDTIKSLENGTIKYTKQEGWDGTYCKMFKKEDGHLSLDKTYNEIDCFVRGMSPWPSAQVYFANGMCKVYQVSKVSNDIKGEIGEILSADDKKGILVQCKDSVISLDIIQRENSKRMASQDFVRGFREKLVGEIIK